MNKHKRPQMNKEKISFLTSKLPAKKKKKNDEKAKDNNVSLLLKLTSRVLNVINQTQDLGCNSPRERMSLLGIINLNLILIHFWEKITIRKKVTFLF